ncbi:unnamed protein product, partial [Prunus brigantina]
MDDPLDSCGAIPYVHTRCSTKVPTCLFVTCLCQFTYQDFLQSENKMEFPSIPESSLDLNLSPAPPSTQKTSHENVVFPHSNFHTGSTSVQVVNMHNEMLSSMHLHNEMARRKRPNFSMLPVLL